LTVTQAIVEDCQIEFIKTCAQYTRQVLQL